METVYFTERLAWRDWLENNFQLKEEVWMIYPKKSSGKPRLEYNSAVEEALCFGWIDSIQRKVDELHTAQRFSIRKNLNNFSQANIERLRWLNQHKRLHKSIVEVVNRLLAIPYVFPEDILDEIANHPTAWTFFNQQGDGYKRIRIAYIEAARKRPDEFQKRLNNFISKCQMQKVIKGYGGIDKYY